LNFEKLDLEADMEADRPRESVPDPRVDRICQRTLCELLGFSERTGSLLAKAGKLRRFEHGITGFGRRKYSRRLVARELRRRWERAVRVQDELMAEVDA
jgi:hypothetical protein